MSRAAAVFEGRTALVTGAASGIGRALAHELSARGVELIISDINRETLDEVTAEIRARGGLARAIVADVADASAVRKLAADALANDSRVDMLFNNAGVAVLSPLERMSTADWEWVVGVNMWGPVRLTQALLPHMLERGSGHIVMTASIAGLVGAPHMAAYSLTKFGVVGFAESLAVELEPRGIAVTAVCPGFVRTNLARDSRYHNESFRRFLSVPPSWYGMDPAAVARRVADAVARRERLVPLGIERIGWYVKRALPQHGHRLTRWMARRMGVEL